MTKTRISKIVEVRLFEKELQIKKSNSLKKISDFIFLTNFLFKDFFTALFRNQFSAQILLKNDFFWEKIDSSEVDLIIKEMSCFEKYLEWELKEKDFLEQKYWITIKFIKENVASSSARIYWKGLSNFSEIQLIWKVKNIIWCHFSFFCSFVDLLKIFDWFCCYHKSAHFVTSLDAYGLFRFANTRIHTVNWWISELILCVAERMKMKNVKYMKNAE